MIINFVCFEYLDKSTIFFLAAAAFEKKNQQA
jgi:hypothetical protein